MRGRVFKRCQCPVERDSRGRKRVCSRDHGSWTFVVDVPCGDGRRRQVSRSGFRTRHDAEAALAALLVDPRGSGVGVSRSTLTEYLTDWLAATRVTLAPTAWANYDILLRRYVMPRLGSQRLDQLKPNHLSALYADLLEHGSAKAGPLSPTTVRLVHRVLRKALSDAVDDGLLTVNPAARARTPRPRHHETMVWSAEDAARFLAAAVTDRLRAAWLLALTCGLRRGEIAGLRWRDVDLEAGVVVVAQQRTTDCASRVITKEPKGTSRRSVDLGPVALAALREWRKRVAAERLELGPAYQETGLVFTQPDGAPYHPARLTELFQALAKKAGVPVIRLHDARHSCATLALAAGIHPKVVQQMLGHASWQITMNLYSHRVDRLNKEAATCIESTIKAAGERRQASS